MGLSVPETAKLAQAIGDSIADVPEAVPLTAAERIELDHRLAQYLADPKAVMPWPEVKTRLLNRK